jgi:hypothetical protein
VTAVAGDSVHGRAEAGAPIGIVGGYGAVGRATARLLSARGRGELRIGGRHPELARRFVDRELGGRAEVAAVDAEDGAGLAAFCADCRLVVNCAGPSYRVLDRVAGAAFAAGADYVDPGGDEPLYRRLADLGEASGRTAVLSAGMMPGLTGLLPRWLAAQGFDRPTRLTAYVGTWDHFTPAAAADYLISIGHGHGAPRAAWRQGGRAPAALEPRRRTELPFFPGRVDVYPYLSPEAERLARALDLVDLSWYHVFDGDATLAVLGRLRGPAGRDLDAAARELARAVELDLFGRRPHQLFVYHLEGETAGRPKALTLVFRGRDTYELSGLVCALAVEAVLGCAVGAGLHYASAALAPGAVDRLRESPAVAAIEVLDADPRDGFALEDGSL